MHGPDLDDTVATWIRLAKPDASDLLAATDTALQAADPASQLLAAVEAAVADLQPKERVDVLQGLLADPDRPAPTPTVLRAAGTGGSRLVPDAEVARILSARRAGATNAVRRKHLLQACATATASVIAQNWRRCLLSALGAAELLMAAGAAPAPMAVGAVGGIALIAASWSRSAPRWRGGG